MQSHDEITIRQLRSAETSLRKMEQAWGVNHIKLIAPLQNYADLLFALGNYAECEQICWRILSISTRSFGDDHVTVARALQLIGEVCEVQGLWLEAERFYLWSWNIRRNKQGADADLTEIMARLCHLYRSEQQAFKARVIELRLATALLDKKNKNSLPAWRTSARQNIDPNMRPCSTTNAN